VWRVALFSLLLLQLLRSPQSRVSAGTPHISSHSATQADSTPGPGTRRIEWLVVSCLMGDSRWWDKGQQVVEFQRRDAPRTAGDTGALEEPDQDAHEEPDQDVALEARKEARSAKWSPSRQEAAGGQPTGPGQEEGAQPGPEVSRQRQRSSNWGTDNQWAAGLRSRTRAGKRRGGRVRRRGSMAEKRVRKAVTEFRRNPEVVSKKAERAIASAIGPAPRSVARRGTRCTLSGTW
jgi:hypothetical protein